MFLLKCSGWSERRFNNRDDAYTAGDFIFTVTGSTFVVQETHSLNGVDIAASVVALIRTVKGSNMVSCIKAIRDLTGAGLKESKDFVDAL